MVSMMNKYVFRALAAYVLSFLIGSVIGYAYDTYLESGMIDEEANKQKFLRNPDSLTYAGLFYADLYPQINYRDRFIYHLGMLSATNDATAYSSLCYDLQDESSFYKPDSALLLLVDEIMELKELRMMKNETQDNK
jgi:hypothetical protein